ncbi:MAG: type II toxin-antitoxin system VapC family toxin [Anaerolineales bacterium]|nr:type II toxin-antitoxin system VapC family toxin [Anaerolineales bacterium]
MSNKRKVIQWDSNILIAIITGEERPKEDIDGIRECNEKVEKGEVDLIISGMYEVEVLHRSKPEVVEVLTRILRRPNVSIMSVDMRVLQLAGSLREYYVKLKKTDGLPALDQADAIHLATAIHYHVDAFYTFDDGKKNSRSLLSLDGNIAGYPLKICKPPVTQFRIPTVPPIKRDE